MNENEVKYISIEYKSTGTLINEVITTRLKMKNIGPKKEFIKRERDLVLALETRRSWIVNLDKIIDDINELNRTLEELWWEQETLYQSVNFDFSTASKEEIQEIALSGINTILLNKKRSELTRKIDEAIGEESTTVLEKSWKR